MAVPSISLVTPNLNYGKFLDRALSSVLDQGYPALDYIVVDGGSTDESVDIIKARATSGLRWKVIPGLGQYEAINYGFAQSSSEIMGWMNSDDMQLPWTLRTVAAIFEQFPEIEWIVGAPSVIQDGAVQEVAPVRPFSQEALALGLYTGGFFGIVQQESCFWRRRLWNRVGPLNAAKSGLAADFDLWIQFARQAELVACTALLGGFTVHSANRSRIGGKYAIDVQKIIAALSAVDQVRRKRLARWHQQYIRWRPYIGIKGLVRRLSGLIAYDGPVICRDVAGERFILTRQCVFP